MAEAPRSMSDIVGCICEVAERSDGKVSLESLRDAVGGRAFGPLLLVAGLITVTPVSAVPGVATLLGACVVLVAGQIVLGQRQVWLPRWALNLKVSARRLEKAGRSLVKPARVIDRYVRARLTSVTEGFGRRAAGLACAGIGLLTPILELIPFSTALSGTTIAIFGLGLTTRDGVIVLAALGGGALALAGVGFAAADALG